MPWINWRWQLTPGWQSTHNTSYIIVVRCPPIRTRYRFVIQKATAPTSFGVNSMDTAVRLLSGGLRSCMYLFNDWCKQKLFKYLPFLFPLNESVHLSASRECRSLVFVVTWIAMLEKSTYKWVPAFCVAGLEAMKFTHMRWRIYALLQVGVQ